MRIRRMLDLSQDLYHNSPGTPNFDPPKLDYLAIGPRDGWKLERLTLTLHSGTHMDAPSHRNEFRTNLDEIPVERFQGKALYIPLAPAKQAGEPITPDDLAPYADRMDGETIVLLYTGWGEKRAWTTEWIYQSPFVNNEAARFLVRQGVRGVAIDHFSVGGTGDENDETHRILLGADIWIAEGLQLDRPELAEGDWHLFALPIKVRESSGAPARIVAVQYD